MTRTESATEDPDGDAEQPGISNSPSDLRVVEITRSVAGAACGRLFAAMGHDVVLCEPVAGHQLRRRPLTFAALAAGKKSAVAEADGWSELIAQADILVVDLPPAEALSVGLDAETLGRSFPRLVTVSLTTFNPKDELSELEGDSFLAEAYGGLAQMIGEPDRYPLSLGGEQTAHTAAFVGLLGASLALKRLAETARGDFVEVALSDVAAYMDWKSDVAFELTGKAPIRTGASRGAWRVVEAKDGWVGVIFLAHQWPAVVDLLGDERLRDEALLDASTRFQRETELWPVIAESIRQREAYEVFVHAQELGLPFAYAATASDLIDSVQLAERGFVVPADQRSQDSPVVRFPLPGNRSEDVEHAPKPGDFAGWVNRRKVPEVGNHPRGSESVSPLTGLVVLDFGTITAGAATSRLLSDYGATVLKIESESRPDMFRRWVMPGSATASAPTMSPMFLSNNAGKTGLCVDMKSEGGRAAVHELILRTDVLVENFRVGVTERMGIDPATVHKLNPNLIYVSLSSQGSTGPESGYASYGSTLDLLSGLASATGYPESNPMWSSGEVNYPDQVVAVAGAAFAAHALATNRTGAWLDISQRELVAWTVADQLAAFVWDGVPMTTTGNRRPYATPHDVYPTRDGGWIAVACFTDEHRRVLAEIVPGLDVSAGDDSWRTHEDLIDERIGEWSTAFDRDEAAELLRKAGVPAVPVHTAADRAAQPHQRERGLALRSADGEWLKGVPLVMRGFVPTTPGPAPDIGTNISGPESADFTRILKIVASAHGEPTTCTPDL